MFKRRDPRSYSQIASEIVYPRGGWRRATTYVWHRLRRLPDQPHRIGRGIAAGVFISFTPMFGLHFVLAMLIAWAIRGNVFAALLGTFAGNALTTPLIAVFALTSGRWMMGLDGQIGPHRIFGEFYRAGNELWQNFVSLFTPTVPHWQYLGEFMHEIFWPYWVGGLVPGLAAAVASHYLTVPVIRAYHKRRTAKMNARIAKLREAQATDDAGTGPAQKTGDNPDQ